MTSNKKLLELILFVAVVVALFSFLKGVSHFYPSYFSWDMDLTTTIDLLHIQSNRLHVHFAHPATGMYMILKPIHNLLFYLGHVDTLNLNDLAEAHNPTLAMAQLTTFARSIIPYIATLTFVILCLSVLKASVESFYFRLLAVGLLGTGFWLLLESSLIRTELFAWFFIALACLCAICAAKTEKFENKRLALIVTGIGIGMAYYTKIQALTSLVIPGIIYFMFEDKPFSLNDPTYKKISRLNIAILLFLIIASLIHGFPPDTYIEHFRGSVFPTMHGLLISGTFLILLLRPKRLQMFSTHYNFVVFIGLGFLISFAVPLFQYPFKTRGIELALINFQSVVMTKIYSGLSQQVAPTLEKILTAVNESLPAVIPVIFLYGMILLIKKDHSTYRRLKWGLGLLMSLIVLNLIFVIRDASRHDVVWYEPLSYCVILFSLSYIWLNHFKFRWIGSLIVIIMIINNVVTMNTASHSSQFSYGEERPFLKHSYPGQRDYTVIFSSYLAGLDENQSHSLSSLLLQQARQHESIDYFIRFNFINVKPDIRWVSSAQKGFKVLPDDWRVSAVSDEVHGKHLLDLKSAVDHTPKSGFFKNLASHLFLEPEFTKIWQDPRSIVLTRPQDDAVVQVLLDPSVNLNSQCSQIDGQHWVEIAKPGHETKRLQSYECSNKIPFETLNGPILAVMIWKTP